MTEPSTWAALTGLDYFLLFVILFSAIISLFRGFIREAMSLITWVVAVWLVLHFSDVFVDYLKTYVHSPGLQLAISALLVVMGTLIVGLMLSQCIMMMVRFTGLSGLDRLVGFFCGIARGGLIVLLLLVMGKTAHLDQRDWWKHSQMVVQFKPAMEWMQAWLPSHLDELAKHFYGPVMVKATIRPSDWTTIVPAQTTS